MASARGHGGSPGLTRCPAHQGAATTAELMLAFLVSAAVACLLLARWSRVRRGAIGLGDGDIISTDDSIVHAPTLRSELLGLVGRCDHLLKVNGAYVPVEQKPTAHRLQQSQVLHVGVLCLLVQDTYGVRPPYGIVVLAGGHREQVIRSY